MAYTDDLEKAEHLTDGQLVDRNLNYEDLLRMVQQLPQAYRTVFNLFAIDGYSHDEIGEMLNISSGTSKSNLHKARHKLQQMILKADEAANNRNYNSGGMGYNHIVAICGSDIHNALFNNGIRR
jgi:DNA-directed RNA polymerase specialized sigma24 family protein